MAWGRGGGGAAAQRRGSTDAIGSARGAAARCVLGRSRGRYTWAAGRAVGKQQRRRQPASSTSPRRLFPRSRGTPGPLNALVPVHLVVRALRHLRHLLAARAHGLLLLVAVLPPVVLPVRRRLHHAVQHRRVVVVAPRRRRHGALDVLARRHVQAERLLRALLLLLGEHGLHGCGLWGAGVCGGVGSARARCVSAAAAAARRRARTASRWECGCSWEYVAAAAAAME